VHACTPPARLGLEPEPAGSSVPYFNNYFYAFVGKVVGYAENESKDPALAVEVLDAWTPMQKPGDVLNIRVSIWSGCSATALHTRSNFDPKKYPVGTRLRVVTVGLAVPTWDSEISLAVLGVAP
jgi:hypothetical protein